MPPTTGGSTSGSSTSERSRPWPGNWVRASTTAIGTPITMQASVLMADVRRLRASAALDPSEVISSKKLPHSTRETIATSGSSTNTAPARAGT